jgi:hypothetical protein
VSQVPEKTGLLDSAARSLFARQILLREIGEEGQARLCAARVWLEGDPRAVEVARDYLERAGVTVAPDGVALLIEGAAGRDDAAAVLAGAFTAVEAIKAIVGAGAPARLRGEPG